MSESEFVTIVEATETESKQLNQIAAILEGKKGSALEHLGYENSNSKYSVLIYNANSIESHEGDSLLMQLGSTD